MRLGQLDGGVVQGRHRSAKACFRQCLRISGGNCPEAEAALRDLDEDSAGESSSVSEIEGPNSAQQHDDATSGGSPPPEAEAAPSPEESEATRELHRPPREKEEEVRPFRWCDPAMIGRRFDIVAREQTLRAIDEHRVEPRPSEETARRGGRSPAGAEPKQSLVSPRATGHVDATSTTAVTSIHKGVPAEHGTRVQPGALVFSPRKPEPSSRSSLDPEEASSSRGRAGEDEDSGGLLRRSLSSERRDGFVKHVGHGPRASSAGPCYKGCTDRCTDPWKRCTDPCRRSLSSSPRESARSIIEPESQDSLDEIAKQDCRENPGTRGDEQNQKKRFFSGAVRRLLFPCTSKDSDLLVERVLAEEAISRTLSELPSEISSDDLLELLGVDRVDQDAPHRASSPRGAHPSMPCEGRGAGAGEPVPDSEGRDPEYGSEEPVPDSEDSGSVEIVAAPSSTHDAVDNANRPPVVLSEENDHIWGRGSESSVESPSHREGGEEHRATAHDASCNGGVQRESGVSVSCGIWSSQIFLFHNVEKQKCGSSNLSSVSILVGNVSWNLFRAIIVSRLIYPPLVVQHRASVFFVDVRYTGFQKCVCFVDVRFTGTFGIRQFCIHRTFVDEFPSQKQEDVLASLIQQMPHGF